MSVYFHTDSDNLMRLFFKRKIVSNKIKYQ